MRERQTVFWGLALSWPRGLWVTLGGQDNWVRPKLVSRWVVMYPNTLVVFIVMTLLSFREGVGKDEWSIWSKGGQCLTEEGPDRWNTSILLKELSFRERTMADLSLPSLWNTEWACSRFYRKGYDRRYSTQTSVFYVVLFLWLLNCFLRVSLRQMLAWSPLWSLDWTHNAYPCLLSVAVVDTHHHIQLKFLYIQK